MSSMWTESSGKEMSQTSGFDFAFENSQHNGLTKREYFAGVALQGLLASPVTDDVSFPHIATMAVIAADKLIIELNIKEVKC